MKYDYKNSKKRKELTNGNISEPKISKPTAAEVEVNRPTVAEVAVNKPTVAEVAVNNEVIPLSGVNTNCNGIFYDLVLVRSAEDANKETTEGFNQETVERVRKIN